jgi:hypothetical protein
MELLNICLTTTYFQFEDKFCQQKEGLTIGNSLSPVVSNIRVFMEHFEEIALDTTNHKPAKWLRYVDDIFMVWPHGPARLQQLLHHLNLVRPIIKFTMEVQVNEAETKTDHKSVPEAYSYWLLSALQVQPPTSREKGSRS